jgi:hypothetical protein
MNKYVLFDIHRDIDDSTVPPINKSGIGYYDSIYSNPKESPLHLLYPGTYDYGSGNKFSPPRFMPVDNSEYFDEIKPNGYNKQHIVQRALDKSNNLNILAKEETAITAYKQKGDVFLGAHPAVEPDAQIEDPTLLQVDMQRVPIDYQERNNGGEPLIEGYSLETFKHRSKKDPCLSIIVFILFVILIMLVFYYFYYRKK